MSLWLSAANRGMGAARGQAAAAAKRQATAIQAEAAKQIIDFWSGKTAMTASARKKKRTKR
ncbi:MAG TPA: hypothetical protein VF169_08605 [Albitalea sp.]|uniref:hypothetical protein n=1 Tax=Piscinibacter sp. TaxID=1903157 RepID=UPI002ED2F52D